MVAISPWFWSETLTSGVGVGRFSRTGNFVALLWGALRLALFRAGDGLNGVGLLIFLLGRD